ncbi:triose-phosphate isomerase [Granulicella sp. WH15]|uniref:triose-phosphate isomerase n=1 Tax=Granulicella sp. WH15 TaxID=2602070 RepID=UPI001367763C|nr:triose-phosphate isomerase [Granulicella sp. WH15]QHN04799.1 triose-phosphate isomerase [Granulicella sp. WH15]
MRKPLIAGNWKMYKTPKESLAFLERFLPLVATHTRDEIALFPTMSSLGYVIEATHGTNVSAGAQTMHWLNEGPYTGQTSPTMLASIHCTHVLLGHSERRIYANETDEMVNLKLKAAIGHGLVPIVCVGETLEKRQSNLTEAVLRWQIANALNGVEAEGSEALVIAYEPIWAIGTGSTATPTQVSEAHRIIRREIAERLGQERANQTRILYGGSVKPENTAMLMAQPEIDGALVGGASLDPDTFARIVCYAS